MRRILTLFLRWAVVIYHWDLPIFGLFREFEKILDFSARIGHNSTLDKSKTPILVPWKALNSLWTVYMFSFGIHGSETFLSPLKLKETEIKGRVKMEEDTVMHQPTLIKSQKWQKMVIFDKKRHFWPPNTPRSAQKVQSPKKSQPWHQRETKMQAFDAYIKVCNPRVPASQPSTRVKNCHYLPFLMIFLISAYFKTNFRLKLGRFG